MGKILSSWYCHKLTPMKKPRSVLKTDLFVADQHREKIDRRDHSLAEVNHHKQARTLAMSATARIASQPVLFTVISTWMYRVTATAHLSPSWLKKTRSSYRVSINGWFRCIHMAWSRARFKLTFRKSIARLSQVTNG